MVTGSLAATAVVAIVNVGEVVAPAPTVTEAGSVTPGSLLERFTTIPLEGALPFSTTVPVVDAPPVTELAATFKNDNAGGCTVRIAVLVELFALAEMVTGRLAGTGVVVMINVGETVAPAATVTEAGRVTLGSLLVRVTTIPPGGAGAVSETVLDPVMALPPTTEFGESDTAATKTFGGGVTVRTADALMPL
jgi:hypothetical protein